MDQASLLTVLKTTGLPVSYHHFVATDKTPIPSPPYIVYLFTASNNVGADNIVYAKGSGYQVELYSKIKDLTSENKIEDALDSAEIYWDKSEQYIESESLYQVVYQIEI